MNYANEAIIAALKATRENGGLSQRDLGAKLGVPQSHISRIENGGADIRLSSLIELARALELELVLVPRRLTPAVDGILRGAALPQPAALRDERKELDRAVKALRKLAQSHPDTGGLDRLRQLLREFGRLRLGPNELAIISSAADKMTAFAGSDAVSIAQILGDLQTLRNRIVHAAPAPPQPAYSLEDDDDA